jgi:GR25 family glycosyltransferase involved in LPS biosynthesis
MVNRKAAKKLTDSMLPISEQVDHAIDRPWKTGLRVRGVRPMPVKLAPVASAGSTIGYEDRGKIKSSFIKTSKLFFSRASKEILRFSFGVKDALS